MCLEDDISFWYATFFGNMLIFRGVRFSQFTTRCPYPPEDVLCCFCLGCHHLGDMEGVFIYFSTNTSWAKSSENSAKRPWHKSLNFTSPIKYCWWKKSGDHQLRVVVYLIICSPPKNSLGVEPTPLKNMSQNGFIFPRVRGEHKKYLKPPTKKWIFGFSPGTLDKPVPERSNCAWKEGCPAQ